MKFLLILVLVLVVLWLWRNSRRADRDADAQSASSKAAQRPRQPQISATEVVACAVCQVHLPRSEALAGPGGVYCSAAHRQQAADQGRS
jgi:uncharacterized protein